MRDKLIEILYNGFYISPKDELNGTVQKAADYLIAHGVTLAEDNNALGKKPITNGDRMRAMTDEELAKIMSVGCCGGENGYCICDECGEANCENCWHSWLKQLVEEEI